MKKGKFIEKVYKRLFGVDVVVVATYGGQVFVTNEKGELGMLVGEVPDEMKEVGTKLRVVRPKYEQVCIYSHGSYKSRDNVIRLIYKKPDEDCWIVKKEYGAGGFGILRTPEESVEGFETIAGELVGVDYIPCYSLQFN